MSKIFEIELPQLPDPRNWTESEKAASGLALAAVASMAKTSWTALAAERLAHRRKDFEEYSRSIQDPEILPGVATISLVGKHANDIEFGRASYDLRDVLLNTKYVRIKKRGEAGKGMYRSSRTGGLYRPIPFRHAGPDSQGAVGQPMGSQFAKLKVGAMSAPEANALGQYIYKAAKELKASTEAPNRKTQWGERLIAGLAPKLKQHHATDIFAGMTKVRKQYDKGAGAKYMTFRTISTAKRTGWIMPATNGVRLMAALAAHMKMNAPALVSQILGPK